MPEKTQKKYAYGDDEVEGVKCPASAAGYCPSDGDKSAAIAEEYDEQAIMLSLGYKGVISEDQARKAWQRAIDAIARERYESWEDDAGVGEEIQSSLGWR